MALMSAVASNAPSQTAAIRFGLGVMFPAPGLVEMIGPHWDWLWLDGQHGQIAGYDNMLAMVRACDLAGCAPYVRVPDNQAGWIGVMLDTGAAAIIVPQIDTADQARQAVRFSKFPPLGNRSYGSRRLYDRQGPDYHRAANQSVRLFCQIESPEALDHADSIAAVEGVDGLFFGPDDMTMRWKCSGATTDAPGQLHDAIRRVGEACQRHGLSGICPAGTPELITLCIEAGFDHLVISTENRLLRESSSSASALARQTAAGLVPPASTNP